MADGNSLGERLRTPPVARAMFSPSATLLAGGGAALGILIGGFPAGLVLAPVLGLGMWAVRVLAAAPRGLAKVHSKGLPEPWRSMVNDALRAKSRFTQIISTCAPGPLRDELNTISGRVDDGVREASSVARKGVMLDAARKNLDLGAATSDQERLTSERALRVQNNMDVVSLDTALAAVNSQLETGRRIERIAFEARDRLRVLNAQLDEVCAAAIELTVRPAGADAGGLSSQVDGIVTQLETLRTALDEAAGADAPTTQDSTLSASPL